MRYLFAICIIFNSILWSILFADINNGLRAYYPFNGNANDESGNGNNGIVNGAVLTEDRFGTANSAYYFSSSGGNTRIDVDVNFPPSPVGFAISFWINRSGTGYINPRVLEFYDGTGPGGDWQIEWFNDGYLSYMNTDLQNDVWYHVVVNFDGANFVSYLNGSYEGTWDGSYSAWTLPFAGDGAFGRMNHPAWDAFNGKLDDILIYDRELTEDDIQSLYNYNYSDNFSLNFDGDDDYIHLDTSQGLGLSSSSTIQAWVKVTGTQPNDYHTRIFSSDEGSGGKRFLFSIKGTGTEHLAEFRLNQWEVLTEDIGLNNWVNVAATYDGNYIRIFHNGILADSLVCETTINLLDDSYIGYGVMCNTLDGFLDEIAMWDIALTEEQINDNICTDINPDSEGLVAYWKFNEGLGQIAHDSTINNVDGSIYGASWSSDVPCDDQPPLPIELSSFTAIYSNDLPMLNWITQSESNNQGWNIFRADSDDLNSSMQVNTDLVPGAGTTSMPTEYSYNDESVTIPGNTYWYWLQSVSSDGETEDYGPITLDIPGDNFDPGSPGIPDIYGLHQNYPNPFNPSTRISYMMPEDCTGTLTVYDIKGQEVITLIKDQFIGKDEKLYVDWDSRDNQGRLVGSGVYIYKLSTNVGNYSRKMVLTK
ncbi:MAG: T9SS type A sorting domain-containing protein [Candidatus Atribacteria bacterium]|nr:T9SS type A sorting domain-containing protein [Candidatus Atribacteria bacterium]